MSGIMKRLQSYAADAEAVRKLVITIVGFFVLIGTGATVWVEAGLPTLVTDRTLDQRLEEYSEPIQQLYDITVATQASTDAVGTDYYSTRISDLEFQRANLLDRINQENRDPSFAERQLLDHINRKIKEQEKKLEDIETREVEKLTLPNL